MSLATREAEIEEIIRAAPMLDLPAPTWEEVEARAKALVEEARQLQEQS